MNSGVCGVEESDNLRNDRYSRISMTSCSSLAVSPLGSAHSLSFTITASTRARSRAGLTADSCPHSFLPGVTRATEERAGGDDDDDGKERRALLTSSASIVFAGFNLDEAHFACDVVRVGLLVAFFSSPEANICRQKRGGNGG